MRCSTLPPIVARLRICADAACRHAEASAPGVRDDERVLADLVQRGERADAQGRRRRWRCRAARRGRRCRRPGPGAAMPSRNQLSSSVPPAISDVPWSSARARDGRFGRARRGRRRSPSSARSCRRGGQHGRGDLRVGRAAADVAAHPLAHAGRRRRRGPRRCRRPPTRAGPGCSSRTGTRRARRRPAAPGAARRRSAEALDGRDLAALALHDQGQAAVHAPARRRARCRCRTRPRCSPSWCR